MGYSAAIVGSEGGNEQGRDCLLGEDLRRLPLSQFPRQGRSPADPRSAQDSWTDLEDLRSGDRWPSKIEAALRGSKAAAVFVGKTVGPVQELEIDVIVSLQSRGELGIVPVILPSCPDSCERRAEDGRGKGSVLPRCSTRRLDQGIGRRRHRLRPEIARLRGRNSCTYSYTPISSVAGEDVFGARLREDLWPVYGNLA